MIKYNNRYSDTDTPDKRGRWARIAILNNIQIAWITKHILKESEKFSVSCNFPTLMSDIAHENKVCDSLEEAKDFVKERWEWFLKAVS